jgi:hypothetical protein
MLDLLSFSEQPRCSCHCLKLNDVHGAGAERAPKKVSYCGGFIRANGHCSLLEVGKLRVSSGPHRALRGEAVPYENCQFCQFMSLLVAEAAGGANWRHP